MLFGLPFLRDIGMGTSKVKVGDRVAVIGGGNTAIDCAREALRQGAVEVTMITVEANPQEMPASPEDLHDMLEEGVELMHGLAMTSVLGDGKVEALQLHPARFTGKINASPIAIDQEAPPRNFLSTTSSSPWARRAKLDWMPAEYKTERGTIKIDAVRPHRQHELLRRGRRGAAGAGQPLMVVNAVGDGKRVAFNLDKVLRNDSARAANGSHRRDRRSGPHEHDVFPAFPARPAGHALAGARKSTQQEVILAYSEEQASMEASRCFSCGTCNACDNCYLVCPEPCIVRSVRSNGLYKILVDYCKGCRVCIEECPTGCLEGVPELDFDTGVVRMDTAFAISPGLHGRQAKELSNLADRPAKSI